MQHFLEINKLGLIMDIPTEISVLTGENENLRNTIGVIVLIAVVAMGISLLRNKKIKQYEDN